MPSLMVRKILDIATQEMARFPRGFTVMDLRVALRRRNVRVSVEELSLLLREEGRPTIVRVADLPERYAVRPKRDPAEESVRTPDPWQRLTQDMIVRLSDVSLDVMKVEAVVRGQRIRARFDVVAEGTPALWFCMPARGPAIIRALAATEPRTLSAGWTLLLRRPPAAGDSPPPWLLVWSAADPRESATVASQVLKDGLGLAAAQVRLDSLVCTPAEVERRSSARRAISQVRARRASSGFARATCLRCGQPLTHPDSLRYGVGPECRRYYGAEFFRAMTSPQVSQRMWFGAKKPKIWLRQVLDDFKWVRLSWRVVRRPVG